MVNGAGAVVGMNTMGTTDYFYAISNKEIMDLLKQLNVPFETTSGSSVDPATVTAEPTEDAAGETTETTEPTPEPEPVVDKTSLNKAITEASALDSSAYTKESFGLVETELKDAQEVVDNADATQEEVDAAKDSLNTAVDTLETAPEGLPLWIILAIAAAVVVIIIIIIIIIVASNKGKKQKTIPGPGPMPGPGPYTPPSPNPGPGPMPTPIYPPMDGAGETGILNEGSADTTVLGGAAQAGAYLIRVKNSERIPLTGGVFTIGKERRRVSYCISDNTAISRCHAQIARKGNTYYVTDMNSTNFTFVNGVKASPNQDVACA